MEPDGNGRYQRTDLDPIEDLEEEEDVKTPRRSSSYFSKQKNSNSAGLKGSFWLEKNGMRKKRPLKMEMKGLALTTGNMAKKKEEVISLASDSEEDEIDDDNTYKTNNLTLGRRKGSFASAHSASSGESLTAFETPKSKRSHKADLSEQRNVPRSDQSIDDIGSAEEEKPRKRLSLSRLTKSSHKIESSPANDLCGATTESDKDTMTIESRSDGGFEVEDVPSSERAILSLEEKALPIPFEVIVSEKEEQKFSQKWPCPACTLENLPSALCCEVCNTIRPALAAFTREDSQFSTTPRDTSSQGSTERKYRQMLLTQFDRKSEKRDPSKPWTCSLCYFVQVSDESDCLVCGHSSPMVEDNPQRRTSKRLQSKMELEINSSAKSCKTDAQEVTRSQTTFCPELSDCEEGENTSPMTSSSGNCKVNSTQVIEQAALIEREHSEKSRLDYIVTSDDDSDSFLPKPKSRKKNFNAAPVKTDETPGDALQHVNDSSSQGELIIQPQYRFAKFGQVQATSKQTYNVVCATVEDMWPDKFKPQSKADLLLSLQKNKIEEVEKWLLSALNSDNDRVLLLHGPSGVGKSSCIKVLAKEHGLMLREWKCESERPTTLNFDKTADPSSKHSIYVEYVSALKDFESFVRGAMYPALVLSSTDAETPQNKQRSSAGSLLFIENLPSVNKPGDLDSLHRTLKLLISRKQTKAHKIITCLLFTSEGETANPTDMKRLFSDHFFNSQYVKKISFKNVAQTRMEKALLRIIEQSGAQIPSERVSEIVAMSSGDLRRAVMELQFEALGEPQEFSVKSNFKQRRRKRSRASKRQRIEPEASKKKNETKEAVCDKKYSINHAIGKIIRGKLVGELVDQSKRTSGRPPPTPEERLALCENVDEVVSKCQLDPDPLLDFLQDNFVHHFPSSEKQDLVALSNSLDAFAQADLLSKSGSLVGKYSKSFTQNSTIFPGAYVAAIGARAAFVYRSNRKDVGGFKQVMRPQIYDFKRRKMENDAILRNLSFNNSVGIISQNAVCDILFSGVGQRNQEARKETSKKDVETTKLLAVDAIEEFD